MVEQLQMSPQTLPRHGKHVDGTGEACGMAGSRDGHPCRVCVQNTLNTNVIGELKAQAIQLERPRKQR